MTPSVVCSLYGLGLRGGERPLSHSHVPASGVPHIKCGRGRAQGLQRRGGGLADLDDDGTV